MTKSEFIDWKANHITEEVFKTIVGRISDLVDELSNNAGKDPVQDAVNRGAILAFRDILNIDYEDEETHE